MKIFKLIGLFLFEFVLTVFANFLGDFTTNLSNVFEDLGNLSPEPRGT